MGQDSPLTDVSPALLDRIQRMRARYKHLYLARLPLAKPWERRGDTVTHIDVLVRPLTQRENEEYRELANLGDVLPSIVKQTVLSPRTKRWKDNPIHKLLPGDVEGIGLAVIALSEFDSKQSIRTGINYGRSQASNLYAAFDAFICNAFPAVDPRTLGTMEIQEKMRLLGLAEVKLGEQFPIERILNPRPQHSAVPWDVINSQTPGEVKQILEMANRENAKNLKKPGARRRSEAVEHDDLDDAVDQAAIARARVIAAQQAAAEHAGLKPKSRRG